MSDTADMFKKLAQNRQKTIAEEAKVSANQETKPDLETTTPANQEIPASTSKEKPEPSQKRGRPATGKRSDPDWIGRTYYIRKETDFDIEDELIALKRQGVSLDKSELVDFLLAAWVKWQNGDNINIQIGEISPRQKNKSS